MVAAENTWQGISFNSWPYSKVPQFISGKFATELYKIIFIDFEENEWNYRDGKRDFNDCIDTHDDSECASIFDPRPHKYKNK